MDLQEGKQMADELAVAPQGLKAAGQRLWEATVVEFDMDEHDLVLLREICRTADGLDALQVAVDRDGVLDESTQGRRAHPALVELRQQRIVFARLVAQLGIPDREQAEYDDDALASRRGSRGVYGIKGVVS
jgi:hypothetical protein